MRRYPTGIGLWERFEHDISIDIFADGFTTVQHGGIAPDTCSWIPQEELDAVRPYLEPYFTKEPSGPLVCMGDNPYTWKDDWRAKGPLIFPVFYPGEKELKGFGLFWDGKSCLPEDLETAVIGTLSMICSNSRFARKYLLRGLPEQVAGRLECSAE